MKDEAGHARRRRGPWTLLRHVAEAASRAAEDSCEARLDRHDLRLAALEAEVAALRCLIERDPPAVGAAAP